MVERKERRLRRNMQLILTITAVLAGILFGFLMRLQDPSDYTVVLIGFPGEILMNMLKMMILPLIAASLISGLSQLDAAQSGRIGMFAFMYYSITMTLAVITGVSLVLAIHPGNPAIKEFVVVDNTVARNSSALDNFLDIIRNMFPDNILHAAFESVQSEQRTIEKRKLITNGNGTETRHHIVITVKHVEGINVLGIIVFCIVFGVTIGRLGDAARSLKEFFISLDTVITRIVVLIMWYAPVGIASLIAQKILEIDDLWATLHTLSLYVVTVLIGLCIHLFLTEPMVYFCASRRNPYVFMRGLTQAAMTAIGTASSAASLPVTFRCLEEFNKVDPRISKFVLPVGAMVNMDGTALYEAVASIFIAQLNGIELSASQVVTVSLTATLAAIGAASIPSAGLVTMLIVLTAVGLPVSDISLIIAVDWFLDRIRTCVNVVGDGFGCGFVDALCNNEKFSKVYDVEGFNNINLKSTKLNDVYLRRMEDRDNKLSINID